jgi:oligosaccharide repeat unit polymerase
MGFPIILALILLTLFNYRTCRDMRYPPFLASALWLAALTLYYLRPISIDSISILTPLIFVTVVLSFTWGGQISFFLHRRKSENIDGPTGPFKSRVKLILLVVSLVLLPAVFERANSIAMGTSLLDWFTALRVELTLNEQSPYGVLGNASILSYCITFIYAIELRDDWKEKLQYYLSLAISVAYAVLSTGRTPILLIVVSLMAIAAMRHRLKWKNAFIGALSLSLAFALFAVILGKGGNVESSVSDNLDSVRESMAQYAIGPIAAFDRLVRADPAFEYGRNTFLEGVNLVRRLTGFALVSPIQEEVNVPFPVNVYTAVQPPFKDFGIVGVVLAFGLIGAVSTYFYLRAVEGQELYIFCYSLILFPLFFMTFSDQYFAPVGSWIKYLLVGYLYFRYRDAVGASLPVSEN